MKRIIDIIITGFISFEVVFIAGFALLVYLKPSIFISLAVRVNTANDLVNYLALIPAGIVVILMRQKDELLFPTESPNSQLLQNWPGYHMLLDRYWMSVFWAGICSLPTLLVWIFKGDLTEYVIFSLFFGSIIVSIITALTFFSATITLKRILSTTNNRHNMT